MTRLRFASFRALFATAILAAVPNQLSAQGGMLGGMGGEGIGGRPFKIAIDGGLTLASGEIKSFNENGFHGGASIIFPIPGLRLSIRPEFTYTSLRVKSTVVQPTTFAEKNFTRVLTGMGHVEMPFSNGLYLFVGAGAMNLNIDLARDTTTRSGTALILGGGGGYRFEFGPILSFLEFRYGTAKVDEAKFPYPRASVIPLSFGFVF